MLTEMEQNWVIFTPLQFDKKSHVEFMGKYKVAWAKLPGLIGQNQQNSFQ